MSCHPAIFVRIVKKCAIFIPMGAFFMLCLVTIQLAVNDTGPKATKKGQKETLMDYVQRISLCDRMATNTSDIWLNSTEWKICQSLQVRSQKFYKRQNTTVNVYNHSYMINGADICDKKVDVMVLVHSLHDYRDRRDAIRNTWGNAAVNDQWPRSRMNLKFKLAFIFGKHRNNTLNEKLAEENSKYHDIIQGDFIEDYKNMTLKSLLGLKWMLQSCPSAKYLLKSDDDMFLNIPYLLNVLKRVNMTHAIMGPYNGASKALRSGKWKISREAFPFYYYPPYESGSAYVISKDLISELFETSYYVPYIFIDDVYITGILAKMIGARHIIHEGFAYWTSKKPKVCDIIKLKIITGTGVKPSYMMDLWKDLQLTKTC